MSLRKVLTLACLVVAWNTQDSWAQTNAQFMTSPMALAMGNAYVAHVTDEYSIFYNPAGLGRNDGVRVSPFNLAAGSTDQIINTFGILSGVSGNSVAQNLNELAGEKVFVEGYTMPYVQFPYVEALGLFRMRTGSFMRNPVYPDMNFDIYTEYGFAFGVGVPIIPKLMYLGGSVKYVSRSNTVTYSEMPASEMLEVVSSGAFNSSIKSGDAYAATIGTQITLPTGIPAFRPVVGAAWEDIGGLVFRNDDISKKPEGLKHSINAGLALIYDLPIKAELTFAFDVRRFMETEVEYPKKLHYGIKFKMPMFTLYGGISQGYPCGGVTIRLPVFDIDLLTYGEELGSYANARGDRRYMFRLSMGFDFDGFKMGRFPKRPR